MTMIKQTKYYTRIFLRLPYINFLWTKKNFPQMFRLFTYFWFYLVPFSFGQSKQY